MRYATVFEVLRIFPLSLLSAVQPKLGKLPAGPHGWSGRIFQRSFLVLTFVGWGNCVRMMQRLIFAISLICVVTQLPVSLVAQTADLRVSVANLSQDMSQLSQQVRALKLEIEQLQRENRQLRAQLAEAGARQETEMQISSLGAAIEALRRDFSAADAVQKDEILAEVSRQMRALAQETEAAIAAVAAVVGSEPKVETPVHFSNDYPKTGITYTVRSGDTLSKIAREHNSTSKHIQNANKIVNPAKDLQVGQTIFIPIAQ